MLLLLLELLANLPIEYDLVRYSLRIQKIALCRSRNPVCAVVALDSLRRNVSVISILLNDPPKQFFHFLVRRRSEGGFLVVH